ncbi:hypothetical protein CJ099_18555 [Salmonella enterica]|uniref:Uncharacterized protein n=1 Tax=Salmonella enterica TaxID=28901 RepID=A0A5V2EI53_SALER|nr:hypothetical protein [Salmonella enterica]
MFFLVFKTTCHCPQEGWFIIIFIYDNNSFFNLRNKISKNPKLNINLYPLDTKFLFPIKFLRNGFLIFSLLYS